MKFFRIGLVLLALAGCGKEESSAGSGKPPAATPGTPAAAGDRLSPGGVKPAAEDTLMLHYPNDPNTINPILGSDTVSEEFQRWVIDTLAE